MSFQKEQYWKVTNTYLAGSVSSQCFDVTVYVIAQKTEATFKYQIGEEQSKALTYN